MKTTKKVTKEVTTEKLNVPQIKSIVGEKKYNKEMVAAIQGGATPTEAPELIARRLRRANQ